MKKSFFCIILSIFALFFGCKDSNSTDITMSAADSIVTPQPIDTLAEVVTRVQQQSKLYTTECQVHKVVLYSDNASVGGKLFSMSVPGDRKVAIPIDVTLKAYVDFSSFTKESIATHDSLVIITLPDPQVVVTASKLDHEATRQYVSLTRKRFTEDEISRLAAQGEDSVMTHISQFGIIERSRETCARTLVPILTRMGYAEENIVIRFRKKYDDNDLRRLTSTQK